MKLLSPDLDYSSITDLDFSLNLLILETFVPRQFFSLKLLNLQVLELAHIP